MFSTKFSYHVLFVACVFTLVCSAKKIYKVYMESAATDERMTLLLSISPVPITACLLLCGNDEECERVGFQESLVDNHIGDCELYKLSRLGDGRMPLQNIYQVYSKEAVNDDKRNKEEASNFTLLFKEKPTSNLPSIARLIQPATKQMSVCFWYNMNEIATKKMILFTIGDEEEPSMCSSQFQLVTMYGRFYLSLFQWQEFYPPDHVFISEKQWNHVCVVKNATEYRLYVNAKDFGMVSEIPIVKTDHLSALLTDLRDMTDDLVDTLRQIVPHYTQNENNSESFSLTQAVDGFSTSLVELRDVTIQSLKENGGDSRELSSQLQQLRDTIEVPLNTFKNKLLPDISDSSVINQSKTELTDKVSRGISDLYHTFAVHTNRTRNSELGIVGKHTIYIGGKSLETGLIGKCEQYYSQPLRITKLNVYKKALSAKQVGLSFLKKLNVLSEFFVTRWVAFKHLTYDENLLLLPGAFSLKSTS